MISLIAGAILRILATIFIAFGDKLNWKEKVTHPHESIKVSHINFSLSITLKVFVAFSWMAKASVQAALGPIALKFMKPDDPDRKYAEIVLMMCILSIVLTAPIGAMIISITGTKLLTKTKPIVEPEGMFNLHLSRNLCKFLIITRLGTNSSTFNERHFHY